MLGVDILTKYVGLNITDNADQLRELLASQAHDGDIAIDPTNTSWCAATVNFAERSVGNPGTGSCLAQSFNNYGTPVDPDSVKRGDILVLHFSFDQSWQGHVTYFDSQDDHGNFRCLGGNQSHAIQYSWYPANVVKHIRRYNNE